MYREGKKYIMYYIGKHNENVDKNCTIDGILGPEGITVDFFKHML